ncbi:ROK family protein [Superficieibacter sp. HKU1]|uniref:ROK family protein n=1 Tax=Superficieibacter sp. HKU1 TaxID=3031919 RepID=UPI0023E0D960|nr:ROK family protein [Superficieibacter sp. HKU1]WES67513.1 ROK family protein [Superficieibacter sp. HKU1]
MAIVLFDWGGTSIKHGVWQQGALVQTASTKTPASWPAMKSALLNIFQQYQQTYAVEGVSVSAPGNVDPEAGIIGGLSAIPYIHHFAIVDELTALFNLPVCIENDANAAGIAEAALGAGQGKPHVLFVIAGTGIGGAIVKNNVLQRGSHKYAGEFGLMTLDDGKTFSELGTAVAMAKRYNQRTASALSGAEVFQLAHQGDAVAEQEVDQFYHWMATGLLNLQVCYDPDCIILGGGISANQAVFAGIAQRLRALVCEKGLQEFMPEICLCQYGSEANLIGAAVNFEQKMPRG